jgi:myosin heavy subunit
MINFANERLQRHFNKHVFEKEQQTYKDEDINWKFVTYSDNSDIV